MKAVRVLFVAASFFLLTACGGGTPTEPTPVEEQPTSVETPTTEPTPVPPTPAPPTPEPTPTQPPYAPFCDAAPVGCEAPTVEMLDNSYCIKKVPYAIMSVPMSTTYEALALDMACIDQLHSDGSLRVTCHSLTSQQLISYDLRVCNDACSAPTLEMGTGQCPEGYGYDRVNSCCAAPPPSSSDGCTIYTVNFGVCAGNE